MIEEIHRHNKKSDHKKVIGLTGCMVRKTGLSKKYLAFDYKKTVKKIELLE